MQTCVLSRIPSRTKRIHTRAHSLACYARLHRRFTDTCTRGSQRHLAQESEEAAGEAREAAGASLPQGQAQQGQALDDPIPGDDRETRVGRGCAEEVGGRREGHGQRKGKAWVTNPVSWWDGERENAGGAAMGELPTFVSVVGMGERELTHTRASVEKLALMVDTSKTSKPLVVSPARTRPTENAGKKAGGGLEAGDGGAAATHNEGKVEWGVVEVELAEQQARLHRQVSLRYMCTYYIYIYDVFICLCTYATGSLASPSALQPTIEYPWWMAC